VQRQAAPMPASTLDYAKMTGAYQFRRPFDHVDFAGISRARLGRAEAATRVVMEDVAHLSKLARIARELATDPFDPVRDRFTSAAAEFE